MSPKFKPKPASRELPPARILAWLERHPDFLVKNPKMLERMELPQDSDGTVSFQAYQAHRLGEENVHLKAMFEVAKRNQKLIDHALILAAECLLDRPRSLSEVIQGQEKRLRRHFPNAGWAIRLRPEIPRAPARYKVPEHPGLMRAVRVVFQKGPQILSDRNTVELLWPKSRVDSDTLVIAPLKRRRCYGILCRELSPEVDHEGDTTLLMQVANLMTASISRFCEPRKSS